MRFWTLGTSAAVATEARDNLSLLVRAGHEHFLVDCSGSPVHKLAKLGCDFTGLSGVIVTHGHPDHIYGLPALVHALKIRASERLPLPIFGPPHAIEVASKLLLAFWDKALLPSLVALSPIPLEENRLLFSSSSVHIFTSPVEHGPETLAVRFVEQKTGASLVYSSDTLPCESMVRFASGADDLLHDSTFCKESNGAGPLFGHSSAREAAVVARRAGVKRLILVHFANASPDVGDCVALASREFEGQIVAAGDLQEFVRDRSEDG